MFGMGPDKFPILMEGCVDGSLGRGQQIFVGAIFGISVWIVVANFGCGRWFGRLFCCQISYLVTWDALVGRYPQETDI